MGKGKKRQSAKTGDQKLYANRGADENIETDVRKRRRVEDNDFVNDATSRFSNETDRLKFGESDSGEAEDSEGDEVVMELGGDMSSSSDDDDNDDDDRNENENANVYNDQGDASDSDSSSSPPSIAPSDSDDSDSDAESENSDDVRTQTLNWGSRKSNYYSGDVADLEIGQDVADAYDEEAAVKEVERVRFKNMDDGDFLSEDSDSNSDIADSVIKKSGKKTSSEELELPSKDLVKVLSAADKIRLLKKETPELITLVEHFKRKSSELGEILPLQEMLEREGSNVGATEGGMQFLKVKKICLMAQALNACLFLLLKSESSSASNSTMNHPVVERLNALNEFEEKLTEEVEKPSGLGKQMESVWKAMKMLEEGAESEDNSKGESESEDDGEGEDEDEDEDEGKFDDEFDSGMESDLSVGDTNKKSTMAIMIKKKNSNSNSNDDDDDDDDTKIKKALAMMEADGLFDNSEDEEAFDQGPDENDNDDSNDNFYESIAAKTSVKKNTKKQKYAVAPKFPTIEKEIEGERAAGYQIMKNRGLVPHKNKLNRNPRVKKREQYRKALIRRRGAVRDIRTGEVDTYAGEGTGIKSGISRSRKITS